MNICRDCKHARRGEAIDLRPRDRRRPPPSSRPSLRGGDFICGRGGLTPAPVDPQTGFQALPGGPDCRDLNPSGECLDFKRGLRTVNPAAIGAVFGFAVMAAAFALQWAGL